MLGVCNCPGRRVPWVFAGLLAAVAAVQVVAPVTGDPGVWTQDCPAPLWHSLSCSNASDKASHGLTPSWCGLNNPFITPQPPMQLANTASVNQSVAYTCTNDSDPFSDCACPGACALGAVCWLRWRVAFFACRVTW